MTRAKTFAIRVCALITSLGTLAVGSAQAAGRPRESVHATIIPAQTVRTYYQNPLRSIRKLYAKRIDEGVDYGGAGPVKALGTGTITVLDKGNSYFWANVLGNVVVVQLAAGPLAGLSVYTAENCTPNRALYVGEQVTAATTLCRMHNHFPYIETGFAENNNSGIPSAWPVYQKVPDGSKTAYGLDYSRLLGELGAPQGNTNPGVGNVSYKPRKTVGKLPPGFPRF